MIVQMADHERFSAALNGLNTDTHVFKERLKAAA